MSPPLPALPHLPLLCLMCFLPPRCHYHTTPPITTTVNYRPCPCPRASLPLRRVEWVALFGKLIYHEVSSTRLSPLRRLLSYHVSPRYCLLKICTCTSTSTFLKYTSASTSTSTPMFTSTT